MTDGGSPTQAPAWAQPTGSGAPVHDAGTLLRAFSDPHGRRSTFRAAEAVRTLQQLIVDPALDDGSADRIATVIDQLVAGLPPRTTASRYPSRDPSHPHASGHPIAGPGNPLAPPIRLHAEGEVAVGLVTYGPPYEGPPGRLQGGVAAAGFDIVLAFAGMIAGKIGYTRSLSVHYRAGVPIGEEVRYEARPTQSDDRRITIEGRLVLGDGTVAAEAVGEFALPRPPHDPTATVGR